MRNLVCSIVAIGALLFWGPSVRAGDGDLDRASLRGLESVSLVVEDLPHEAEQDGLTRGTLEADAQLELRHAGVNVVPPTPQAQSVLHVSVNLVTTGPSPLWPYVVLVELKQDAWLVRGIAVPLVSTWSTVVYGHVAASNIRSLRDTVKDQVGKFIIAYLAMNPTGAGKDGGGYTNAAALVTLDLQEKCARGARAAFKAGGWETNPLAGFTNHYNAKMGKCFVQIADIDTRTSPGTTWIGKRLSDAFEGKVYGEYNWQSSETKKAWEVRPVECYVMIPSGERKSCESAEEFDALVKAYME